MRSAIVADDVAHALRVARQLGRGIVVPQLHTPTHWFIAATQKRPGSAVSIVVLYVCTDIGQQPTFTTADSSTNPTPQRQTACMSAAKSHKILALDNRGDPHVRSPWLCSGSLSCARPSPLAGAPSAPPCWRRSLSAPPSAPAPRPPGCARPGGAPSHGRRGAWSHPHSASVPAAASYIYSRAVSAWQCCSFVLSELEAALTSRTMLATATALTLPLPPG